MKIGILTFHSQTNYGGVLQAFALQETLKSLGHEVVIIDRWMDKYNSMLKGISSSRSLVGWVKFMGRALLGFGDFADYIRHVRTAKLLPRFLDLTPYNFFRWKDAPKSLGVDVAVVGSDQVWNPYLQGGDLPYLLKDAPKCPTIAYAASFGIPRLPVELESEYCEGLKRFSSISVREKEGVRIVESLGHSATHVLDPTLLADESIWDRFRADRKPNARRKLVCYLIQDPVGIAIGRLRKFAKEQDCNVEIFVGGGSILLPSTVGELFKVSSGPVVAALSRHVHARGTATPDEFIREISSADWVLTDSFHALMFSTIFKRNVRVLKPRNGRGAAGFARLEEFARDNMTASVFSIDYNHALRSLVNDLPVVYDDSKIKERRKQSMQWLQDALSNVGRNMLKENALL